MAVLSCRYGKVEFSVELYKAFDPTSVSFHLLFSTPTTLTLLDAYPSYPQISSDTKSFMPELISDSLSLVEAVSSDVATTGSTDTGTMKPEIVLGLS
ncbi:Hypothetical predicted protein [Octopus vulgaris]|uniref:Uncharacterized protein n=1 Tax=Octopus vulgaris TaxID=6645 RepID=A0AA36B3D6_OCTVU|nr:Hypothetical predicted protein [Octopus vulgaris]